MPNLNTIVQNTVDRAGMHGKLWSKVPANNSLLGPSTSKSLINTDAQNEYRDYAEEFIGESQALRSKVQEYDENKKSFQSDFQDRMSALRKANNEIKALSSGRNEDELAALRNARKEARQLRASRSDEAGYLRDKATDSAAAEKFESDRNLDRNVRDDMDAIQGFVKEYNSTVSYFSEGRDVSKRFTALASSFSGNDELSGSLDRVGISVNPDGQLSVDRSRLAESLAENPSEVGETLGANGLAGHVERKVEMASGQTDKLFTPPTEALGGGASSSVKSMYSSDSSVASNAYSDVGSIYHNLG